MFCVSGFSSVGILFVVLQERVDLLRRQVDVKIVVRHHHRRAIAGAEADVRQKSKAAVGGGLAETDAEPLGQMRPYPVVSHHPTAHTVTEKENMLADRSAENLVVKGGDPVQFVRGHV